MGEVELAEPLYDRRHERLVVLGPRDIAGEELRLATSLLDLAHRLLASGARLFEVCDEDGAALLREPDRSRPPDPARRTGHQPCLALHQASHCALSFHMMMRGETALRDARRPRSRSKHS